MDDKIVHFHFNNPFHDCKGDNKTPYISLVNCIPCFEKLNLLYWDSKYIVQRVKDIRYKLEFEDLLK